MAKPNLTGGSLAGEKDLTAILVEGDVTGEEILRTVVSRGYGDLLCRVAPLPSLKLTQVEVHRAADGLPCEDPELVALLSKKGRAAFVHVNHGAKQAIVHGFVGGKPSPGFAGAPGDELEAKLREAIGHPLAALHEADDGSRLGIGVASTNTVAVVRGTPFLVPPGTPTEFNSFSFHDRGQGLDEGGERLAFFTFDPRATAALYAQVPGREVAEILVAQPPGTYGPLEPLRVQAIEAYAALGDRSAEAAGMRDVRALEVATLACARAFSSGL